MSLDGALGGAGFYWGYNGDVDARAGIVQMAADLAGHGGNANRFATGVKNRTFAKRTIS